MLRKALISMDRKTVLMAMSGGVDSSVAAKVLMDEGYDVTGITMRLVDDPDHTDAPSPSCAAKAICDQLGIDHIEVDLRNAFQRTVIDDFCTQYLEGKTPNPCVACNKHLKFGALHSIREEKGFDYLATGHYVRSAFNDARGVWELRCAKDKAKDQSYFLYNMTQAQLAASLFPLGDMYKEDVRARAATWGFKSAHEPESQDICFIHGGDYVSFVEDLIEARDDVCKVDDCSAFASGDIVNAHGDVLGEHRGLIRYTIGQRKGIGVAASRPLYVIGKDTARNRLVVGFEAELLTDRVLIKDVTFIDALREASGEVCATSLAGLSGEQIDGKSDVLSGGLLDGMPDGLRVKTHYRQEPRACTACLQDDGMVAVLYDKPANIAACGQSAVIYRGESVVCGGIITTE